MTMRARAWVSGEASGPGILRDVEFDGVAVGDDRLVLEGLVVEDVRGGSPLMADATDLCFDPAAGGGPLVPTGPREQARAFGIVNVAFHVARGLDWATGLLSSPLPPLTVKIGMHEGRGKRWGGGHYRLPSAEYSSLPEDVVPAATGEIHLGPGAGVATVDGGRYFLAPSHNAAIVYHELGHHITRHTADFRLNRLRSANHQANHKTPLDEGTADFVCAVMLGTPDIYGWHRAHVPSTSQARRRLDAGWTMAVFRGGSDVDPHTDGTVWSSTLWGARCAVEAAGVDPGRFDGAVLRGLGRMGSVGVDEPMGEALRHRRYFSEALQAVLEAEQERGGALASVIERSFAAHGIVVGATNAELRDRCRRRVAPLLGAKAS
jgi:hypothetical protein